MERRKEHGISRDKQPEKDALYIFISQSGETYDTTLAAKKVKESGAMTLAIVNNENSTLWDLCDYKININAGKENSIAATKSFPNYFKLFFPLSAPADDVIIHEFELFDAGDIPLKTFPFDPERGTLMVPPLIDLHNRTGITKSSARSTYASSRGEGKSMMKRPVQRKRTEPIIRKPAGIRPPRPLINAMCVTPVHRG